MSAGYGCSKVWTEKATLRSRSRFCTQARASVVQIVTAPASHRNHTGTMCGDPSRRTVAMTPSGVGKVWTRNPSSSAVLMPMISYLSEGCQHACQRRYSAEVQQRARTAASQHDRQHPELAAMIVKRPATPLKLVRDDAIGGRDWL